MSAVWFATQYPQAEIFVIEPDDNNFEILSRNTAPYSGRIRPLQGGIWCRSGHLAIINPDAGSAAFRVEMVGSNHAGAIRAYTVDEVLAMAGADEALIVKLDIEGSQKDLFSAETDWVGRSHSILLELDDWLYPWQGTSRSFFSCLSRYPFDYLLNGENIVCFRDATAQDVRNAPTASTRKHELV